MARRLTRKETAAQTRENLLLAAQAEFAHNGYQAASVEAIAARAGHTKGAVYAHFPGKAEIFLTVFRDMTRSAMAGFVAEIEAAPDRGKVEDLLCDWAARCSASGLWPMAILEFTHSATSRPEHASALREALAGHWLMLGAAVRLRLQISTDALTLGALLHEIAFAPALQIVATPGARDLMRLVLTRLRD